MPAKTAQPPAEQAEITLRAYVPAELIIDDNIRNDTEATVDKEFVASLKAHAATSPLTFPSEESGYVPCGNHTPVALVTRPDGALKVLLGHRRTIGCTRAGTFVLGFVAGPEGDEATARRARVIDQLTENRQREPLARSEEAGALLALFDLGMTAAGVAKATGIGKPEITQQVAVAGSALAAAAVDRYEFLTLEQAAVLDEFAEDPEALKALVKASRDNPGEFTHLVQRFRDSAGERAQKAALIAELEAAGYQVTDDWHKVNQLGWHNLRNWVNQDGSDISYEDHAACPHRAVRIEQELTWPAEAEAAWREANAAYIEQLREDDGAGPDDTIEVEFGTTDEAIEAGHVMLWVTGQGYCADPQAAGHKDRYEGSRMGGSSSSPAKPEPGTAEAERVKEERRSLLRQNREWRSATEVRIAHLKALLALPDLKPKKRGGALTLAADLPDAALAHIADAIARGEAAPEKMGEGHALACRLLGLTDPKGYGGRDLITAAITTATPARRPVIALAMILAGAEGEDGTWGCCADVHTWQRADGREPGFGNSQFHSDRSRAARYLAFLAEHAGYTMTDLERLVAYGKPAQETTAPETPADDGEAAALDEDAAYTAADAAGPGDDEDYDDEFGGDTGPDEPGADDVPGPDEIGPDDDGVAPAGAADTGSGVTDGS
jgi:ParB family transcriptional regulator, chromosome partitioning protein